MQRRIKPYGHSADNKGVSTESKTTAETRLMKRGEVARKPSERFTRKPLAAKSRASQSERFKVADLVNKLAKNSADVSANSEMKWNGYKPGHAEDCGQTGGTEKTG